LRDISIMERHALVKEVSESVVRMDMSSEEIT